MQLVIWLSLGGGLFSVLAFIHFFVDWIFQSHAEAMVKHKNAAVRAKHCAIYTLGFVPLLAAFVWTHALSPLQFIISIAILFISHFYEDTYIPVYLWALYIRKPPQMFEPVVKTDLDGRQTVSPANPMVGFASFVETPIGKILMIVIDQIIHLTFLIPIVWMVLRNLSLFLK